MHRAADQFSLLTIGVSEYTDPRPDRPDVAAAVNALADVLVSGTHDLQRLCLIGTVTRLAAQTALEQWGGPGGTGILLWSGHCELRGLDVSDSNARLLTSDDLALSGDYLGELVADRRFDRYVAVIDSCYAAEIAWALHLKLGLRTNRPGRFRAGSDTPIEPGYVVIASTNSDEEAGAGVVPDALAEVLQIGTKRRWWGHNEALLTGEQVFEALKKRLAERQIVVNPRMHAGGGSSRLIPNPMFVASAVATSLEVDEAHFLPKARGIEAGETGWYFTGREAVLRQLVTWLDSEQHGLEVVTGSAGSGKSAVLGRLVTLSVPEYREMAGEAGVLADVPLDTLPRVGAVQVALHVRERTVNSCLTFVGRAVGLDDIRHAGELLDRLRQRSEPITVVADAIDEAASGHARRIVDELLAPLARIEGVKVLVGTRRGIVADWAAVEGVTGVIDLDDDLDAERDVQAYAARRLTGLSGSPYRSEAELADRVAAAITRRAITRQATTQRSQSPAGAFLIARVVTRTLASQAQTVGLGGEGWESQLPDDVRRAFEGDLDSYRALHGDSIARTVLDLLTGLAWEEGGGLPRELIGLVAQAVTGHSYTDDDVTTLLRVAGGHITEAADSGRAVYRLYHELFREHLRNTTLGTGLSEKEAHAQVVRTLTAAGRENRWADIDPYSATSLIRHAVLSGTEGLLYSDDDYLVAANPGPLMAAAPWLRQGATGDAARRFLHVAHILGRGTPLERRFALSLADTIVGRTVRAARSGLLWRQGPVFANSRVLMGHDGTVFSVAATEVDGEPVVISTGYFDETVRMWDARSGQPRGEPISPNHGTVTKALAARIDGDPVIVTCTDGGHTGADYRVMLWDARSGQPRGAPLVDRLGRVFALVATMLDGDPIIVTCTDGGYNRGGYRVMLWDVRSGKPRGEPLGRYHEPVWQMAETVIDGDPVIAIRGGQHNETVRLWDVRTGKPRGEPLGDPNGPGWAVAATMIDGNPVIITGGTDGTIQLWDARSGQPRGEPLAGHPGWVCAVAGTMIDGDPVIITGGTDCTVRLWDARNGQSRGELTGHHDSVRALATTEVDGDTLIISGAQDSTVRLWSVPRSQPRRKPPTDHRALVRAVAAITIDGDPVIISGGTDGTVRLWDARNGRPRGEPLTGHHDSVCTVAATTVDGDPVIISGGTRGTVRLWDARSGQSRGEPIGGYEHGGMDVAATIVDGNPVVITCNPFDGVRLRDARTNQRLQQEDYHLQRGPRAVVVTTLDGDPIIISGGEDGTVELWDARTGRTRGKPIAGHGGWADLPGADAKILALAAMVVESDPVIIGGCVDGRVRLWDVRSGQPRGEPITGHRGSVLAVAAAVVDGASIIISGGEDATVRMWDARGQLLHKLSLLGAVTSIAVTGSNIFLACGQSIVAIAVSELDRAKLTVDHAN